MTIVISGLMLSGTYFGIAPVVAADNCVRARELYTSGVTSVNYDQRRAAFQKAVELCPSYAEAHVNLADALENLAKTKRHDAKEFNRLLDMAVAEYAEALKYRKDLFPAYLGLGETLRVMGLYSQSEQAYRQALQLRPRHPVATTGLEKVRTIHSMDRDDFKTSREIVAHFRRSSENKGQGTLMGFKDETVVKDRIRFNNILFDEWSYNLTRPEAVKQLEEIGTALSSPELKDSFFIVEGHTDNRGGEERNMQLSRDRADSVRKHLVKRYKVDASRVQTQGLGYSRPRMSNDSPVNMLKNRRVELLFIDRSTGN